MVSREEAGRAQPMKGSHAMLQKPFFTLVVV